MASKRRLSSSPTQQRTTTDINTSSAETLSCLVCGDKARFVNYGALSCQSCKTFFRRNGFRPEIVRPCVFGETCDINMQTRHSCTYCRVKKCFSVGMTSELIRKEDIKKLKSSKSDSTESITTIQQISSNDFAQNDRSILNESEWTLISNINSAYDSYNNISNICQIINNLTEVSTDLQMNTIDPYEIICQMFTSMRSYLSSSPDFRILDVIERISLLKRNLSSIIGFYLILFFRETNLPANPQLIESFSKFYSSEMIQIVKSLYEQFDFDTTAFKLILFVFVFSTNSFPITNLNNDERDSLIHGTFRITASQNVYLEILWKYMIYRYGYLQSIRRISQLMQIFVGLSKHLSLIYTNNLIHQNLINSIIENIQLSVTNNDDQNSLLWGRQ